MRVSARATLNAFKGAPAIVFSGAHDSPQAVLYGLRRHLEACARCQAESNGAHSVCHDGGQVYVFDAGRGRRTEDSVAPRWSLSGDLRKGGK